MTSNERIRALTITLIVAAALATACGGGNGGGNNTTNNESNNTTNNATTNNDTGTDNNDTGTDNNDTDSNNDPGSNNTTFEGAVTFVAPTETEVFTNGDLALTIAVDGAADEVELVLDGADVLHAFDGGTEFVWDTTSVDEGAYDLQLRYTLDGAAELSEETKRVTVDRTAPTVVATTPVEDRTSSAPDTPIVIEVDEPLDPATVDPTTVTIVFSNDAVVTHTATLSADGTKIEVDFDRALVPLPYTADVDLVGVTDRAGNPLSDQLSFRVEAWESETFVAALDKPAYANLGGTEYIMGWVNGSSFDLLRVYASDGAGSWTKVAEHKLQSMYDLAVIDREGKMYAAALHRDVISGTIVKAAELLIFDPATMTIVSDGLVALGMDGNDGAIALDARKIRAGSSYTFALAAISKGKVHAYKFGLGKLSDEGASTFPTNDYAYVRDESLAVGLTAGGRPDVIFARCSSASVPCFRTYIERVHQTSGGWSENPAVFGTPSAPATNALCDEFVNFDAVFPAATPTLLLSYHSPCNAAVPQLESVTGSASAWDDVSPVPNPLTTMPEADDDAYAVDFTFDDQDQIYALLASEVRLMVAQYGATDVTWMGKFADDIGAVAGDQQRSIKHARIFMSAAGKPIVLFRIGNTTHVWRAN